VLTLNRTLLKVYILASWHFSLHMAKKHHTARGWQAGVARKSSWSVYGKYQYRCEVSAAVFNG